MSSMRLEKRRNISTACPTMIFSLTQKNGSRQSSKWRLLAKLVTAYPGDSRTDILKSSGRKSTALGIFQFMNISGSITESCGRLLKMICRRSRDNSKRLGRNFSTSVKKGKFARPFFTLIFSSSWRWASISLAGKISSSILPLD